MLSDKNKKPRTGDDDASSDLPVWVTNDGGAITKYQLSPIARSKEEAPAKVDRPGLPKQWGDRRERSPPKSHITGPGL
jgi:hypothetical protein